MPRFEPPRLICQYSTKNLGDQISTFNISAAGFRTTASKKNGPTDHRTLDHGTRDQRTKNRKRYVGRQCVGAAVMPVGFQSRWVSLDYWITESLDYWKCRESRVERAVRRCIGGQPTTRVRKWQADNVAWVCASYGLGMFRAMLPWQSAPHAMLLPEYVQTLNTISGPEYQRCSHHPARYKTR